MTIDYEKLFQLVSSQYPHIIQRLEGLEGQEKENAAQEISKLVDDASRLISKAEELADRYGLVFHFSPSYGMGGTYYGRNDNSSWSSSNEGWVSSSSQC